MSSSNWSRAPLERTQHRHPDSPPRWPALAPRPKLGTTSVPTGRTNDDEWPDAARSSPVVRAGGRRLSPGTRVSWRFAVDGGADGVRRARAPQRSRRSWRRSPVQVSVLGWFPWLWVSPWPYRAAAATAHTPALLLHRREHDRAAGTDAAQGRRTANRRGEAHEPCRPHEHCVLAHPQVRPSAVQGQRKQVNTEKRWAHAGFCAVTAMLRADPRLVPEHSWTCEAP